MHDTFIPKEHKSHTSKSWGDKHSLNDKRKRDTKKGASVVHKQKYIHPYMGTNSSMRKDFLY